MKLISTPKVTQMPINRWVRTNNHSIENGKNLPASCRMSNIFSTISPTSSIPLQISKFSSKAALPTVDCYNNLPQINRRDVEYLKRRVFDKPLGRSGSVDWGSVNIDKGTRNVEFSNPLSRVI